MQRMHFEADTDTAYVILKIDNIIVLRDARITQVIENPLQYFIEGKMILSSDGPMRAFWK